MLKYYPKEVDPTLTMEEKVCCVCRVDCVAGPRFMLKNEPWAFGGPTLLFFDLLCDGRTFWALPVAWLPCFIYERFPQVQYRGE